MTGTNKRKRQKLQKENEPDQKQSESNKKKTVKRPGGKQALKAKSQQKGTREEHKSTKSKKNLKQEVKYEIKAPEENLDAQMEDLSIQQSEKKKDNKLEVAKEIDQAEDQKDKKDQQHKAKQLGIPDKAPTKQTNKLKSRYPKGHNNQAMSSDSDDLDYDCDGQAQGEILSDEFESLSAYQQSEEGEIRHGSGKGDTDMLDEDGEVDQLFSKPQSLESKYSIQRELYQKLHSITEGWSLTFSDCSTNIKYLQASNVNTRAIPLETIKAYLRQKKSNTDKHIRRYDDQIKKNLELQQMSQIKKLISYFDKLSDPIQTLLTKTFITTIESSKDKLFKLLDDEGTKSSTCLLLSYQEGKSNLFREEVDQLLPEIALLAIIKASASDATLTKSELMYYTMYPTIQQLNDFSFVKDQDYATTAACLDTIAITLSNLAHAAAPVAESFIILCCHVKAFEALKRVIRSRQQDSKIIIRTLSGIGFTKPCSQSLVKYYDKLFFDSPFYVLKNSLPQVQNCNARILKSVLHSNTTQHEDIKTYLHLYKGRDVFERVLKPKGQIPLSVSQLNQILNNLWLSSDTQIEHLLTQLEPYQWLNDSYQFRSSAISASPDFVQLTEDAIKHIYETKQGELQLHRQQPLEDAYKLSIEISKTSSYKHDPYQAMIASLLLNVSLSGKKITWSKVEPGQGKTYIISLLHRLFNNKPIIILTANQGLKLQMMEQVGDILKSHPSAKAIVLTFDEFYANDIGTVPKNGVLIIDEADEFYNRYMFTVTPVGESLKLQGIWSLKQTTTIALSGTQSLGLQKMLTSLNGNCEFITFQSELQLVKGSSSFFCNYKTFPQTMTDQSFFETIANFVSQKYSQGPIILFLDPSQDAEMKKLFQEMKYPFDIYSYADIPTLTYYSKGLLILNQEHSRGLNAKFKQNAVVIIMCSVKQAETLDQMVTRGNRQRGVSEGYYFSRTNVPAEDVKQHLMKQDNLYYQNKTDLANMLIQSSSWGMQLQETLKTCLKITQDRNIVLNTIDDLLSCLSSFKEIVDQDKYTELIKAISNFKLPSLESIFTKAPTQMPPSSKSTPCGGKQQDTTLNVLASLKSQQQQFGDNNRASSKVISQQQPNKTFKSGGKAGKSSEDFQAPINLTAQRKPSGRNRTG